MEPPKSTDMNPLTGVDTKIWSRVQHAKAHQTNIAWLGRGIAAFRSPCPCSPSTIEKGDWRYLFWCATMVGNMTGPSSEGCLLSRWSENGGNAVVSTLSFLFWNMSFGGPYGFLLMVYIPAWECFFVFVWEKRGCVMDIGLFGVLNYYQNEAARLKGPMNKYLHKTTS